MNRLAAAEILPGEEAGETPPRASVYSLLSSLFTFPGEALYSEIRDGRWADLLSAALHGLPHKVQLPGGIMPPGDYEAFQSEYIRLFELGGRGGAPCPLHSGHYATDRPRTLERLIRFYNFFGLHLADGAMPDHAAVQFEFMHYLAATQAVEKDPLRRLSLLRAQGDFVTQFLANWWPLLTARLRQQADVLPVYLAGATLADRFLAKESQYLRVLAKG